MQIDKTTSQIELNKSKNDIYKVEAIYDSAVYAKESKISNQVFIIWFYRKATLKKKYLKTCFNGIKSLQTH